MSVVVFLPSSASSTRTTSIDRCARKLGALRNGPTSEAPKPSQMSTSSTPTVTTSSEPKIPTWKPPTCQELLEKRRHTFTDSQKAGAWAAVADTVNSRSDEVTKRWNREVDIYLIVAGLFSALLMVSNIHSYQLLQPPTVDPAVLALERISAQLSSFTSNPPFINSTQPAFQNLASTIPISPTPRTAIWLNGLWFSSLILALSATFVGVLVKQWLDAYHSGIVSSDRTRETLRLRQYRFIGLMDWNVGAVIAAIPVLLHTALSLFFAGLIVLLYTVHEGIASAVAALVGLLATFVLVTVLLPLFKDGCSYITPATHVLYIIYPPICTILCILSCVVFCVPAAITYMLTRMPDPIGRVAWPAWIPFVIVPFKLFMAADGRGERTFRKWEKHCVCARQDALDGGAIVIACETTPGTSTMDNATMCLSDAGPPLIISVFERVYGKRFKKALGSFDFDCTTARTLWIDCLLCLADRDVPPAWRQMVLPALSDRLLNHARSIESCDGETKRAQVEDALLVFSVLAFNSSLGPGEQSSLLPERVARAFWRLRSKMESISQAGPTPPAGITTVKTNQALLNYAKAAETVFSAVWTVSQFKLSSGPPSADSLEQTAPYIWETARMLPEIAAAFAVPGLEFPACARKFMRVQTREMLQTILDRLVSAGDWEHKMERLSGELGAWTCESLHQIVDTVSSNDALFSRAVPNGFYDCLNSQGAAAPSLGGTQSNAEAGGDPASKQGSGVATSTGTTPSGWLGRIIPCSRGSEASERGRHFSIGSAFISPSSTLLSAQHPAGGLPESDHQPLIEKKRGNDALASGTEEEEPADEEKSEGDASSFSTLCPSSEQEIRLDDPTGFAPMEPPVTTVDSNGPLAVAALDDNGRSGTADPR
ncbi:hypothetical protein C8Q78DRAFT_190314 [Trametes maxima]|nr:hypothetical protein C8Q78DRAFT_190314 [Trametes maxima]